jgi:hypothetical protein
MSAEADRMRRHRIAMQRAMADNVSLEEARRRIAIEERVARPRRIVCAEPPVRASDVARPIPHQWWMDL